MSIEALLLLCCPTLGEPGLPSAPDDERRHWTQIIAAPTLTQRHRKTSAEFVRSARERLGLTQAELANKLELERRTIMRYETGSSHLKLHVRYALMYLLSTRRHKKRAAQGGEARRQRVRGTPQPRG
jgi:DNA-binding XRE family transcriptional regulator